MIHGENKEKIYGFFVNRTVEAQSSEEATAVALKRVRIEALNKYPEGAEALVLEVEELEPPEGSVTPQGFILFNESPKVRPW